MPEAELFLSAFRAQNALYRSGCYPRDKRLLDCRAVLDRVGGTCPDSVWAGVTDLLDREEYRAVGDTG